MYLCSVCRGKFDGVPSRIVGEKHRNYWCPDCTRHNNAKSKEATQLRNQAIAARNKCKWCDERLSENNRAKKNDNGKHNSNMCKKCEQKSTYRQQLIKWFTAVGVNEQPEIVNYINTHKAQWESIRQQKILKEDQALKQAKSLPPLFQASLETETNNVEQLKLKLEKLQQAMASLIVELQQKDGDKKTK